MSEAEKILIVGGYGQVGQSIAHILAPAFPDRVVIAGRSLGKASDAAAKIGHGSEGRELDIFASDHQKALDDVGLVLVCLDQNETDFVAQCFKRGIHYVDISARFDFLQKLEELDPLASQTGATVVLSVGVAPGLTNLLAAQAVKAMPQCDRIDIVIEIGLGDQHGKTAVEWIIDNLDAPFQVQEKGQAKAVHSFGESKKIGFPERSENAPAYRFNFSDQHVLARTLAMPSVSTWMRFDSRVATWIFAQSAKLGFGKLLRRGLLRKLVVWLVMNVHIGSNKCAVAVQATGPDSRTMTIGLVGRNEAEMTAVVAAEVVRQVLTNALPAGVLQSDQVIQFEPVISALRAENPALSVIM